MSEVINFPTDENVNNNFLKSFISEMEEAQGLNEATGMEEIAALLALKDEDFVRIAPFYLMELEKALNSANDRLTLMESLKISGTSLEEVLDVYIKLQNQIDTELSGILSVPKCNFLKRMCAIVVNTINEVEGAANQIIQIPIEILDARAKIPAYAHPSDAGMDVYALEDITIGPGETKLIPLGFKVAIPLGYELQVRPKSGRALKTKLRIANTPGTIDSGYRDEVGVIIENIEPPFKDISYDFDDKGNIIIKSIVHGSAYTIGQGEKFAQLVLSTIPTATFFEVDSVAAYEGDRGGGFGSSGLK